MVSSMLTIKLPGHGDLHVANLNTTFKSVVADCSKALNDERISQENFGDDKHFFFKANGRSLAADEGFFLENYTLRQMRVKDGAVLELCYVPEEARA